MEDSMSKKIPIPEQRPDLYDDFDGTGRKLGEPTGVKTPDYIEKMLAERDAKTPANNADKK